MAKKKKVKKELGKTGTLIKQLIAAFVLNFALQYILYQQILGDLLMKFSTSFKIPSPFGLLFYLLIYTVVAVLFYNLVRKLGEPGAAGAIRLALTIAGAIYFPIYLGRFIFEAGAPDFLKWSFFLADTAQLAATYLLLDLIKKR